MKTMQRLTKTIILSAACATLTVPTAVQAASDIFLKLDGIEGETTQKDHKGEIEIESWSFGMSRPVGGPGGAGARSVGKLCVTEIALMKLFDKSSPAIITNMVSGKLIPKGTLSFTQNVGDSSPQTYLTIELTGILISGYQVSGSGGDRSADSISLRYSTAKMSYKPQDNTGKLGPAIISTFPGDGC
jgi:type VI secretion system secreted protein Hcp